MIRTRFAPSPTGFLHVGGLRTALFNYLFARQNNGVFVSRIEDTDQKRFVEGGIENMIRSLHWAGITIDEGVDLAADATITQRGNYGPYIQSKRLGFFQRYVNDLLDTDHAYYCFCSPERLEELRQYQKLNKLAPGYDGHCRTITTKEAKGRSQIGETHVIRMKMPREGVTAFTDLIRGQIEFKNSTIDDQILLKSDGFPTYHLANVIDDHLMEITHVIRGEEWLPSTPKHIVLYQMFGWKVPRFAHLSLLVNEQKQKLSKRHGDMSVEDFKEKGYLPEALVNFIAFLGWNPGDEREIFTIKELEKEFSLEKVSKTPAVFNQIKLDWYNKQYLTTMDLDEVTRRAIPFFRNAGVINKKEIDEPEEFEFIKKVVDLERSRATTLVELVESVGFIFADELTYEPELLVWRKSTRAETKNKLSELIDYLNTIDVQDWTKLELAERVGEWIKQKNYQVGDVLWPMRVALSGQKNSSGPYEIADALGKEKSFQRLSEALRRL